MYGELEFVEPIPTDGVVVFKMGLEDVGPEGVDVTVTDELGVELLGSVEVAHFHPGNPEPPGGGAWALLAWRPSVPLAPSSTFSFHLACESEYGNEGDVVDQLVAITTADGPAPPVAAPVALATFWEKWQYGTGEELCCELEQCWEDSCTGEMECEECWKSLKAEGPLIRVTLGAAPAGPPAHQLVYIVTTADGDGVPQFVPPGQPAVFWTPLMASGSGPWCVSWRSKSLATGAESEPTEVCVGAGETLGSPKPAPPAFGCKATVADPDPDTDAGTDAGGTDAGTDTGGTDPDAGGSDATPDTGETPEPDTGTPGTDDDAATTGDTGATAPDTAAPLDGADAASDGAGSGGSGAPAADAGGDGCSTSGGVQPTPLWLVLALLLAMVRRPHRA
jgi:hypothetical protein